MSNLTGARSKLPKSLRLPAASTNRWISLAEQEGTGDRMAGASVRYQAPVQEPSKLFNQYESLDSTGGTARDADLLAMTPQRQFTQEPSDSGSRNESMDFPPATGEAEKGKGLLYAVPYDKPQSKRETVEHPRQRKNDDVGIPIYAMPDKRPQSDDRNTMEKRNCGNPAEDDNSMLYAQVDKREKN